MPSLTMPEFDIKLAVPAAVSRYEADGKTHTYKHPEYSVNSSAHLVATPNTNLYDIRKLLAQNGYDGVRASLASEELALQLALEKQGIDPREQIGVFDDLFGRNGQHIWQWTETGLRVPKGHDATKYETDAQGRKYWVREVLEGDRKVGEVRVPEGNGGLVAEWDEAVGIPKVTIENKDFPHNPYTTHFWFNSKPNKDPVSGQYDLAVRRWSLWHHSGVRGCFDVYAGYGRSDADPGDGFRPVQGSFPVVEVNQDFLHREEIEAAFVETLKAMSPEKRLEKYGF